MPFNANLSETAAPSRGRAQGMAGLGVLTAIAMLVANDFWAMTGHDRFATVNGFFEHRV